jgi:hypothetical protein
MQKALFKDGDTVQYRGERRADSGTDGKSLQPLIYPGMFATITKTKAPDKGRGLVRLNSDDFVLDDDQDGYNVYTNEYGNSAIIWPRDQAQWKLIK